MAKVDSCQLREKGRGFSLETSGNPVKLMERISRPPPEFRRLMFPLLSRHLSHFIAVYENGSIRLAAETIGLTQPAISKRLKQLEEYLGVRLFERTSSGVTPTPFADVLRRRAEIIRREVEFTQAELKTVAGYERGHIRIGSGPVWSHIYMPGVVAEFLAVFPDVSLELETGSGTHFLQEMHEGRIDLYLGARPGKQLPEGVRFVPVREFILQFFAHEGHEIHQRGAVTPDDLLRHRWLGFSRQDEVQRLLGIYLAQTGHSMPHLSLQVEFFETMARVAARTDHIIIGTDTLAADLTKRAIRAIEIDPAPGVFEVGVMCRESLLYYRPVEFLLDLCRRLSDPSRSHSENH